MNEDFVSYPGPSGTQTGYLIVMVVDSQVSVSMDPARLGTLLPRQSFTEPCS